MIHIVPITDAMLEEVFALEKECFSHPWSRDSLKRELHRNGTHFLAAKQNEKIVGYAGVTTVLDEASITNIAVKKECRRMGVGRALLQAQKTFCETHKMAFLTLEVRVSNQPAIALYKSEGFEFVGVRKKFYTDPIEDALLMTFWCNSEK